MIKRRLILPLLLLLALGAGAQNDPKNITVSGFVREAGSAEPLLGVNIYVPEFQTGTVTNTYGFYSLTMPAGDSVSLIFSYVGYQTLNARVLRNKDHELTIDLEQNSELKEVVVEAKRELTATENPQMSRIEIPVYAIKTVPTLLGEKDALKIIQLMPGVQSGSEGNSGLYVRGGGPDQNLIILDDATVYNAYHLFGFFSLFNGDAIRSIELTKGGFPARYGGRLSSVIDINMKEGNKQEFKGEAGIGLISSRLTLEGPIIKGKSSFLISGRRTYVDVLSRPFMAMSGFQAGYFFYDMTAKVNYDLGKNDRIYLSAYLGRDKFYFKEKEDDYSSNAAMYWGNLTGTMRWNHVISKKAFANTSLIYSRYALNIGFEDEYDNETFSFFLNSGIRDYGVKFDIDYLPNMRHSIRTGVQSTYHTFTPNAITVKESSSNYHFEEVDQYHTLESGIYVQDDIKLSSAWRMLAGIRFSHFLAGSRQILRPEPRLSTSYMIGKRTSLKASFAEMNQYIHLLSSTGVGLPTDLWVPATENVGPQRSRQVAIGASHDLKEPQLTLSLEGYYKRSYDVIAYKEGASFLSIDPAGGDKVTWEDNITTGNAESYGLELLIEKKHGDFTGWLGYTLSWIWMEFPELNNGKRFHPRYDRRHDISVVGMYKISEGITVSGTWVYGTGNAISLPIGYYQSGGVPDRFSGGQWGGGQQTYFGEKNSFRMAAYHRLDLGVQFTKKLEKYERTWEVSVYNAYNQKNPFFYYVNYGQNSNKLKQVTLFPLIPSISYNVKF